MRQNLPNKKECQRKRRRKKEEKITENDEGFAPMTRRNQVMKMSFLKLKIASSPKMEIFGPFGLFTPE